MKSLEFPNGGWTSYILGAGFSKAISQAMPVTDELGNDCVARDPETLGREIGPSGIARPNFEVWLSRRAEDQPYRTAAENLAARSVFASAVPVIAESLSERQASVLSDAAPVWLRRLVYLWHCERAPVITFNYDCLIECVADTYRIPAFDDDGRVPWASMLRFLPAPARPETFGEAGGRAPWETFHLYKMHGSLNWFWSPGDNVGATIQRARLPGTFGKPVPMTELERRWAHPGRETFIVPPSALKSSYYGNPVTREIWSGAHSDLRGSSRLVLLGYSLPLTDLSTAGLLASAIESGGITTIDIVDINPEAVLSNLKLIGSVPLENITLYGGPDAVSQYAQQRWANEQRELSRYLMKLMDQRPVDVRGALVYWDGQEVAAVVGVERLDGTLVLDLELPDQQWKVTDVDRAPESSNASGHAPLLDLASAQRLLGQVTDVCVRTPDGRTSPVLDASFVDMSAAKLGHGTWLVLKCPALT